MSDNSIDPQELLNRPEYNQIITCPRTNSLVKFAEAGATYKGTLLFVVPSFCSRLIGVLLLSLLADHYGMRVLSLDRPGCGGKAHTHRTASSLITLRLPYCQGTPRCALKDRLTIASASGHRLREDGDFNPQCRLGVSTMAHPDLFTKNLRVFVTSGWVPIPVSGQMGLGYVPSTLVSKFHRVLPASIPIINSVGASLAFSKSIFSGVDTKALMPPDVIPRPALVAGAPHPQHTLQIPKSICDAILTHLVKHEPMQGVSEDYLLCLGRGEGSVDPDWFSNTVDSISRAFKQRGGRVHFRLWWGGNDGLIPIKGQRWYTNLLKDQSDVFDVNVVQLPKAGHDDLLGFAEVMYPIFEEAKVALRL
ncbi:alpha/beta hydrolase family domain-containing protein [Rhizoctonia solani AG-1 IA]|uniref:Alpha/beta hydrolase family domain-containing protein n=1 Tax=Thanatephorus cucumeris (strain AG1-IA) TaxID=983506 RepID=L8WZF8_THACA|nr:alpha/beta hydrolase family domain-containing protein [Rhizoctonia solani AG-1 IA]